MDASGNRVSFPPPPCYNILREVPQNGETEEYDYDAETNGQIDALALHLCDIAEAVRPGRKKKISFEPVEIRVIRHCLVDWRNREISQGNDVASEVIGELLCLL